MAPDKTRQTALLLEPDLLPTGKPAIALLKIDKTKKVPDFNTLELTKQVIAEELTAYSQLTKDALMACSTQAIAEKWGTLKYLGKTANLPPANQTRELIRHWHDIFKTLTTLNLRWYYKKNQPEKNKQLTAPCRISPVKPLLSFEVVKEKNRLQLQTNLLIGEQQHPVDSFVRHHFLLANQNEFFLLDHKDYEALEKVGNLDITKHNSDAAAFAQHILTKIDTRYPVNRNGHIPIVEINTLPVCRVLLTELNNRFLMLTPQWIYEGIVADDSINTQKEISRNGMIYSIARDKKAEQAFVQTLRDLHKNFGNQRNGYFYLTFADAIKGQWFFKVYQKLLSQDIEIAGMDMLAHFRYSPHAPSTVVEILDDGENLLKVKMELSFGNESVPLGQLQKILLAGQKAVMLKDGSLGILGEPWIKKYGPMVLHGKIVNKELHVLRWIAIPTEEENTLTESVRAEWWKKWDAWLHGSTEIFPVPPLLQAELRPYQHKGYEWLLLLQELGAGGCLADDMGLGKSLQTIACIAWHLAKSPGKKNLIICPASLVYTWRDEFAKFAPSINTVVYHGQAREQNCFTDEGVAVIITTYSTLRNDIDLVAAHPFGIAVLDESHNIKNPGTQISQAVMQIQANFRIALSGTPVINNTFDLYSQLQFVVPGLFGSREFFRSHYANPIDNMQNEEKIAALRKLTAPFILRRTKEQVATELPEKTESILWCSMGIDQRSVYEEILDSTRSSIFLEIKTNGLGKSKLSVLQGINKLRQVCSSPQLVQMDDVLTGFDSIKLTTLMNELENLLGKHKVIVFSQFTAMLHLIAEECNKKGFNFYHFDGQTPPAKRAEMVQAFQQKDSDTDLFLISLRAGNTGLTLTAADYVFLFDPWWNSAVENQAIDRTHRIGQTKNVFAYKMICKDTIEEKILTLQKKKNKISKDLVADDNNFVKSLSEEDVQFLFS